ncbi:Phage tail protein [Halomonas sp. NYA30]
MAFNVDRYEHEKFATGKWVSIEGDSHLKVAYMRNCEYLDQQRSVEKRYRYKYGDEMTADQRLSMHCEAIALGLLKDWDNVGVNGETPAYTPEIGTEALKQNPMLLDFVQMQANNLERFGREIMDSKSSANKHD